MEWLIVYGDGSHVSSDDCPPHEVPVGNVQVVYVADDVTGFRIEKSRPGYWGWRDGTWFGFQTESGYWEYMMSPGWKLPLFGRMLRDAEWYEIQAKAGELATGLRKSGWWRSERPLEVPDAP